MGCANSINKIRDEAIVPLDAQPQIPSKKNLLQPSQNQDEFDPNSTPVDSQRSRKPHLKVQIRPLYEEKQGKTVNQDTRLVRNENTQNQNSILNGVPQGTALYKLLEGLIKNDSTYSDRSFPADIRSITTNQGHDSYHTFKESVWSRPHEMFGCDYDKIKVFDNIDINDIKQGILGVCYLLAALSALAEYPHRLQKIFINKNINKHGVYGLQLYIQGVPTVVIVDDKFPCYKEQPTEALFSKPKGNELWVLLAEKAFAKLFQNYVSCEAGHMFEALEYLTGAPGFFYRFKDQSEDETWKLLLAADNAKHIIGANTKGDVNEKESGLIPGHAYTVVSVHKVEGYQILKLRNPWGHFEWKGDFSDKWSGWTENLKKKLGYSKEDNGVFMMTLADFSEHFDLYSISYYHDEWAVSCIELESHSRHAEYVKFSVDAPCEMYLRVHQKDSRHMPEDQRENFEYSPTDVFIVKVDANGKYTPLLPITEELDPSIYFGGMTSYSCKHGKLMLKEAGEYLVRTKVNWNDGGKNKFVLSAYASKKLNMQHVNPVKNFIGKYFEKLGDQITDSQTLRKNIILKQNSFGPYKCILFENNEPRSIEIELKLTLDNYRIGKHFRNGEDVMKMSLPPKSVMAGYLKQIKRGGASDYSFTEVNIT